MSGPKTSHYSIRAARRQEEARRQAKERKRREELAARFAVAREKCSELEKRAARFSRAVGELRERFPGEKVDVAVPHSAAPKTEDLGRLEDFAARLERDLLQAETALRKAGEQAKANENFRSATRSVADLCEGTERTAAEAIQRFVESNAAKVSGTAIKERREEIDRILGRYGSERWSEATPKLERLVIEALSADSEARFAALTTEIRLQIQEAKRREEARKADSEKAVTLLDRLEIEIPSGEEPLKQRLELARSGAIALPEGIETLVSEAIAKAEQASRRKEQETASGIVRDALMDLGYEVAPVEDTLFVSGGKVYFRKAGWNDYCVRLTVRPDESKINFNVVKVADQAASAGASSRAADIEAENAWCSGYQQLVDTLKARGLETELTRHLPVGAVPVPVVGSDEIPPASFAAPAKKRKTAPKSKPLKGDLK